MKYGERLLSRRALMNVLLSGAGLVAAGSLLPHEALAVLNGKYRKMYRDINKSLWIRQTSLNQLAEVIEYAQRWNIKTLLYSIPPEEQKGLMAIDNVAAKLINKARRQDGLKIIALSGEAKWAYDGQRLPEAVQGLLKIHQHSGGLFDGLLLDVEPQALKAWRGSKRRALAEGYYQLVKTIAHETKALKLPLRAAIHPSFARVAVPSLGSSMLQSVMPFLEEVDIMAYRNIPQRSFRMATLSLRQLIGASVRWRMGATTQNSPVAQKTSYFGKSPEYFIESVSQMDAMARASRMGKNYAGITLQHYQTVSLLTGR